MQNSSEIAPYEETGIVPYVQPDIAPPQRRLGTKSLMIYFGGLLLLLLLWWFYRRPSTFEGPPAVNPLLDQYYGGRGLEQPQGQGFSFKDDGGWYAKRGPYVKRADGKVDSFGLFGSKKPMFTPQRR